MKKPLQHVAETMNHGYLHRALGVAAGDKIPERRVEAAAHSSNEHLAHAARLAETFAEHRPGGTAHHNPRQRTAHHPPAR